ncbi:MAG: pyrroline-5-carboxylate reductase [Rhodocyclaceae bacterium]|nr:pyrroline-5-carboxylate reductase [Rhodocyclaceae bacterium]
MASALIGGLLRTGHPPAAIQVVEPDDAARARLTHDFGIETRATASGDGGATAPTARWPACDIAVLAVKPQVLRDVALAHAASLRDALVVSVAAGIRLADLGRWLGGHTRIVRAMPNTPALVGQGATGLAASAGLGDADRQRAQALFDAVGSSLWVDGDAGIDLVTALSGSGPAYMMLMVEALTAAGAAQGLDSAHAQQLALDTMAGAVALMRASNEPPAVLRARVTSPGGTTERAIAALQDGGFGSLVAAAVVAAQQRAAELGAALGKDPA